MTIGRPSDNLERYREQMNNRKTQLSAKTADQLCYIYTPGNDDEIFANLDIALIWDQ